MSTTQESPPADLPLVALAPLPSTPRPPAPLLHPPGTAGAAGGAGPPPGTWHSKQILALYSTRSAGTGWVYVDGVGWCRLAGTTESGHAALGTLAAAARTGGGAALARKTDNQIQEIYLW